MLRSDGDYDFLGRRDHQVKSRGYRIELGDIETALHSHASVAQAVAVPTPHDGWGTAIIACVVARRGEEITEREVRRHLSSRLPRYMLPAQVRVMEDLPRTSTGKVDRRRVLEELTDFPA